MTLLTCPPPEIRRRIGPKRIGRRVCTFAWLQKQARQACPSSTGDRGARGSSSGGLVPKKPSDQSPQDRSRMCMRAGVRYAGLSALEDVFLFFLGCPRVVGQPTPLCHPMTMTLACRPGAATKKQEMCCSRVFWSGRMGSWSGCRPCQARYGQKSPSLAQAGP